MPASYDHFMRAICIQQPWASLILDGRKTLEVRTWTTRYRGPVLVLASKAWSRHPEAIQWREQYEVAPRGYTLCTVDLVDVRQGEASDYAAAGNVDPTGAYVWVLRDPCPVTQRPVKGRLGLFDAAALKHSTTS